MDVDCDRDDGSVGKFEEDTLRKHAKSRPTLLPTTRTSRDFPLLAIVLSVNDFAFSSSDC
jgi:hypothetical protein